MAKRKKPTKQIALVGKGPINLVLPDQLLDDVRDLILRTREGVAQAVNTALLLLYWQVGQRIRTEILQHQRAAYGEQIIWWWVGSLANDVTCCGSRVSNSAETSAPNDKFLHTLILRDCWQDCLPTTDYFDSVE